MPIQRLGALTLGALTFAAQAQECPRLREFDQMAQTVTERFYDKRFRGLDWNASVARYRNAVACPLSERELAVVVNDLLAQLGASHYRAVYAGADRVLGDAVDLFARSRSASDCICRTLARAGVR